MLFVTLSKIAFGQADSSLFQKHLEFSYRFEKIDMDSAIYFCNLAKKEAEKNNDAHQLAESYLHLGHLKKNKGEYTLALQYSFKALEFYDELADYKGAVKTKALIGTCYSLSHENEMAKEYFKSAIKIGEKHNEIQVAPYQGLGNTFYYQDSIEKAEEIYLSVINLLEETGETSASMTAGIFTNLGNIKYMQDNFKAAKDFYFEGYKLYDKVGSILGICITSYNIGEVHFKLKEYAEAEKYFNITLKFGKSIKSIDDIEYALESLSDVYKEQGSFEKALNFSNQLHSFRDSINKINHGHIVDELQLKYKKEKNESKLREQDKLIRDAKLEKIKNDQFSRSLLFGIVALGLVAFLSLFSYLKIKKKNVIIEESKKEIDINLKEKDLLLKEIHHRVKNNLQMISSLLNLQTYSLKNKDALKALEESKNRVQAIALVHQKLYQNTNITEINLEQYVNELSNLMGNFNNVKKKVNYTITIKNIHLNVDTAVPLGLIICELISNSQKHAFDDVDTAEISINVKQKDQHNYQLQFKDNGKGLPDNFSIENLNSLGFEIIESLSEQLNGDLTIGTKHGMFFLLNFSKI